MAALSAVVVASVPAVSAAGSGNSAALEQYRKLRCEPRSVTVQSAEPLRFAAIAVCYQLPKSFVHDGWYQLVAVDTDAGTVRLVDLGSDDDASRTLQDDGHGGLRWLARPRTRPDAARDLEAWTLPAREMQPRLTGLVELPFAVDSIRVYAGDQCMFIGAAPQHHALLAFEASGIGVRPVQGVRGVRLWHPEHRAFVVQTDANSLAVHQLLDCDGQIRPLAEAEAARFAEFPRQDIVISSRGDWLVHVNSPDGDELVLVQGDRRRSFGPLELMLEDCPDVCDGAGLPLFNPSWSPDGGLFMAHGLFESMVVDPANMKPVFSWKYRYNTVADHSVLLSGSLAMELSKKRGVIFRRW